MGCFCGLVCGRQGLVDGAELVALHLAQDAFSTMGSYGEKVSLAMFSATWELMEEKQDSYSYYISI